MTAPVGTPPRTVRISDHTGLRVQPILRAVLLGELFAPSEEIWLLSPWITDIDVVDNATGQFDAVFGDDSVTVCRFSEALARIAAGGARIHVVTKPDNHNQPFLSRFRILAPAAEVIEAPPVHEKTFCGDNWLMTGSMNFTKKGMELNDEAVTYTVGGSEPGQARLDLHHRWRGGSE